jgi:hypothetical protein
MQALHGKFGEKLKLASLTSSGKPSDRFPCPGIVHFPMRRSSDNNNLK